MTKESLEVGNTVKMREALGYLRDASREFCHLILNSKYNEVFDKYKYAEVSKIRDAIVNANFALSAPSRNCDKFKTKEEAALAYAEECNAFIPQSILWQIGEWLDWLFAEANYERGVLP